MIFDKSKKKSENYKTGSVGRARKTEFFGWRWKMHCTAKVAVWNCRYLN